MVVKSLQPTVDQKRLQISRFLMIQVTSYWKTGNRIHKVKVQGQGGRLLEFSYLDHPMKNDVTFGLNLASQLVSQSEKMAFRFAIMFVFF